MIIVNLKETIDTKQYFYIIMDLCIINLEEYLKMRENKLSINEIKEILNQLNNTFKLLLKENIIHRDLKPSNILLSLDTINKTTFKLSDYGISKILNNSFTDTTNGTPLTKSPEALKGDFISNKSDIWSLGIIIYYMYFKEYPYNGNSEYKIIKDIESNKKLKIFEDKKLNDLVSKMLIVNEKERISWDDYFNHSFFQNNNLNINENKFSQFNFLCSKHLKNCNLYCSNCKCNLCELCLKKEHKSHKNIPFSNIGLTEIELNQLEKLIEEMDINLNHLKQTETDIKNLIKKMQLIKGNYAVYV